MTLCCRHVSTNVSTLIEACMKSRVVFPDIEHFEALGHRHVEEVITLFMTQLLDKLFNYYTIGFFDANNNFSSQRWVWFLQILSIFPIGDHSKQHLSGK